jgi:hypothetical protein
MNIEIQNQGLTKCEETEVRKLLSKVDNRLTADLEQMWYLIDLIWDECGCDNITLDWKKIETFYSHPVWILNSLFSEQDKESIGHREAIIEYILVYNFNEIIDYGGGPGAISRLLAKQDEKLKISIFEPYPSEFGINKIKKFKNIKYIDKLDRGKLYDCLISIDVLEHVLDPLKDLYKMVDCINFDGFLVIGAPFYPVIKCHLPKNFHFRYTSPCVRIPVRSVI